MAESPDDPNPAQTRQPRRRKLWLLTVAAVVLAAVGVGIVLDRAGIGPFAPEMIRVEGVVSMNSDTTRSDTCQGHSEWADVHEGTTIAVSNEQGEVVATGVLQRGRPGPTGRDCAFSFVIMVPAGQGTYRFSVADHRSEHDFTESDIHKIIGLFATLGILDGAVINA